VNQSVQKSPGGEHNRSTTDGCSIGEFDARDPFSVDLDPGYFAFNDRQVLDVRKWRNSR
jgi:hypothetical protein